MILIERYSVLKCVLTALFVCVFVYVNISYTYNVGWDRLLGSVMLEKMDPCPCLVQFICLPVYVRVLLHNVTHRKYTFSANAMLSHQAYMYVCPHAMFICCEI